MNVTCPACGSTEVTSGKVRSSIPVPYGAPANYSEVVYTCTSCGEQGDFTGENDEAITAALDKSASASAASMLDHLAAQGITQANFERCLRLPMRTTARWKTGELSASALALLRIVRTFPWLLEVADANFAPSVVAQKLVNATAELLFPVLRDKMSSATLAMSPTDASFTFNFKFQSDRRLPVRVLQADSTESVSTLSPTTRELAVAI